MRYFWKKKKKSVHPDFAGIWRYRFCLEENFRSQHIAKSREMRLPTYPLWSQVFNVKFALVTFLLQISCLVTEAVLEAHSKISAYVLGCHFSHVRLLETLWPVVVQALLSMEFSSLEYWSGMHVHLQGIFLTQGSNLHLLSLLYWQADSLPLHHLGSLRKSH